MIREMTCIVCPMGCSLKVELQDKKVIRVEGNTCIRGAKYAETECTNPQRTVTSTMRCEDGSVVAVKTDKTIPKENMFDAMKIINHMTAKLPVKVGDVLVEDVYGSNVIATQNRK